MPRKTKIFSLLILVGLLSAGCVFQLGGGGGPVVAGVFKSFDKGETWAAKNLFLHSGGLGSIEGVNVLGLSFDPQDSRALYLNADGAGLLFSYDGADSWQKANPVGNGKIEAAAVDPRNKCVIYATYGNTVLKTIDCSRNWVEIYLDAKAATALAIDPSNNYVVFAGNDGGDLVKSENGGGNWQVVNRFGGRIAKILISPASPKIVYLATKNKGLFKSQDSGATWNNINDGLKPYSGALEYKNLIFDLSLPDSLLLVSKYGLLKSNDGGASWQPIKLITPPTMTDISAVAMNPKDNKEIYYATQSTFYKTTDGGLNWVTKRLPTTAAAAALLVDPNNPGVIYLGLANPSKK
ncbi:MAG: hypothetical protein A2663_03895 [Candidatus Buchananbacteria bacterium RIFCSPHIGHO2_01_FULL_46_12]|uniref:Photosynthesis system II assembly factor Ycf48/Hcf136-like domain-containing protein n=2 Tax=Candidatus Buchananiibacteriota TaxID=1817903 RepID=A0A1G1YLJ5_9BACT|nr:MAG: hypothetical protein A2663_03895 [Candidatus Buchananbacteria bacterium RIFCSPHIGHO2_01_FULL_46_12]OGY53179.1 MAG: hypothetical protein A3B15_02745 [Candidatus Buchananbacteria bacterium RIFCSPLOWO2_01_FULL_45_31]